MSKLTPKQNFLRLLKNELPESVPVFTMGFNGINGETPWKIVGPFLFDETHLTPTPGGRTDIWGVKYVTNKETGFGCIPEPGNFILKDVCEWREIIKAPEMPKDIDWRKMAEKDIAASGINDNESARMGIIGLMPFQQFIAFMGFEEGLCALAEEPEEVSALLHYMADLYVPLVEKTVEYYDIDCLYLLDDTASKYTPFLSVDMYREILKPVYERLTKPAMERGIPVEFHNCGKCEYFLEDMIDFGVKLLDPAQTTNDLEGIKKKYGKDFILCGCFDWVPPITWPEVNEDEIRKQVRDTIDKFAPYGGFMSSASALGSPGDELTAKVSGWLMDECYKYSKDYYNR